MTRAQFLAPQGRMWRQPGVRDPPSPEQRGGAARVAALPKSVKLLERHDHVWMRVSAEGVTLSFNWD